MGSIRVCFSIVYAYGNSVEDTSKGEQFARTGAASAHLARSEFRVIAFDNFPFGSVLTLRTFPTAI